MGVGVVGVVAGATTAPLAGVMGVRGVVGTHVLCDSIQDRTLHTLGRLPTETALEVGYPLVTGRDPSFLGGADPTGQRYPRRVGWSAEVTECEPCKRSDETTRHTRWTHRGRGGSTTGVDVGGPAWG